MRSHQQIVKDRGASRLARQLQDLGFDIVGNTPQRWAERDRIPHDYWDALVELGAATRDELTQAFRPRKRRDTPVQVAA